MLAALGKSLLLGRKKKKSKSGKEMSQKVLNRSNKEDKRSTIKPQNSLVPLSIKTTTIPTENLITTKEASVKDKLLMIKDLLGLQLKLRLSSWSQKMKNMREERRKKREKELEENKEKKKKSFSLNILPKTGILDSLKNFLTFLVGGFLLNLLLNQLERIRPIVKRLAPIAKGIMQFGKFMWDGVIGFIVQAYDKYDELRESVEKMGGEEALEKFDKVSDLLKIVINGAIIAATVALVTRPFLKKGCLPTPNNLRNKGPNINSNRRNNRINNRRTTSGGQQLNRGPLRGIREFFRKFRRGSNVTGASQNVGPLQRMGTQFKKIGEFFKPKNLKNIKLPSIKSFRPSASTVRSGATGLLKGGATAGIGIAADIIVDATFGAIDRKISREQVKKLVEDFGALESLNKIQKRLEKEYDKPVAPWWMLGLMDGQGLGTSRYRDQKFISTEEYKFKYLTDKLTQLSKKNEKVFDVSSGNVDFMKNIVPMDDLATNTSYSQGSYGLITEINNFIQPVVQEV